MHPTLWISLASTFVYAIEPLSFLTQFNVPNVGYANWVRFTENNGSSLFFSSFSGNPFSEDSTFVFKNPSVLLQKATTAQERLAQIDGKVVWPNKKNHAPDFVFKKKGII